MWIVFCKQHLSCSQKTVHTAACLNCSSRTTALQKDDTQGLARQWPLSHTFSSAGNIYRKRSLHLFRCAVSDKISWSINAGSTPRKKNCSAASPKISWSMNAGSDPRKKIVTQSILRSADQCTQRLQFPCRPGIFISVTVRQHFRSYNKSCVIFQCAEDFYLK